MGLFTSVDLERLTSNVSQFPITLISLRDLPKALELSAQRSSSTRSTPLGPTSRRPTTSFGHSSSPILREDFRARPSCSTSWKAEKLVPEEKKSTSWLLR